jgi:hypothetical protein
MPSSVAGRAAVVAVMFIVAILADVAVGASWPGQFGLLALVATLVLVIGSKSIVAPIVSRPAGSRVGELGDPRDDLDHDPLTAVSSEEADRG